jgi:small subunit ribosomal protein S18
MSDKEQNNLENPAAQAAPGAETGPAGAAKPALSGATPGQQPGLPSGATPASSGPAGGSSTPSGAPGAPGATPAGAATPASSGPAGDRPRRPEEERRPWRPRERSDEDGREGGGRFGGRDRFKDGGRPRFGRFFRRKVCKFCSKKLSLHYRDADTLRRFITERGKILPRRITGTCPKHQRRLAMAIKQARSLALLPFVEK